MDVVYQDNRYLRGFDEYGNPKAIDKLTGEIVNAQLKIIVKQDAELRQKFAEETKNKQMIQAANRKEPKFIFVNSASRLDKLTPSATTRLVVLSTFAAYDNRLMLNTRNQMKKTDIGYVLMLSRASVAQFWNEISPLYVREQTTGLSLTDNTTFLRGKLKKAQHDQWLKFYVSAVRSLYKEAKPGNHKHLGYIYQMLPYVNIEHNILCRNPLETNIDLIDKLTLGEFCDCISYDKKNVYRLVREYDKIRFDSGKGEPFVRFVGNGYDVLNSYCIINPSVLYSGSSFDKVKNLAVLSR